MKNKIWATFLKILGTLFLLPSIFAIIIFTLSAMGSTHLHVQGNSYSSTTTTYTLWKWYFPDSTAIYVGLLALTGALLVKTNK